MNRPFDFVLPLIIAGVSAAIASPSQAEIVSNVRETQAITITPTPEIVGGENTAAASTNFKEVNSIAPEHRDAIAELPPPEPQVQPPQRIPLGSKIFPVPSMQQ